MNKTAANVSQPVAVEIPNPSGKPAPSAAKVLHGRLIPAQQQILLYSSNDWEEFILEWVHYQKSKYTKVVRMSGAADMGVDVAGFTDDAGFNGVWDNYQCKHYDDPLTPSVAIPEIAKQENRQPHPEKRESAEIYAKKTGENVSNYHPPPSTTLRTISMHRSLMAALTVMRSISV